MQSFAVDLGRACGVIWDLALVNDRDRRSLVASSQTPSAVTLEHEGKLGYVRRDGIAHIPPAAIQDHLATAS
jgi:hypothetical protein